MDASTTPQVATPLLQLRGIHKRFVQPVDLAGKIANLLGAHNAPSVVHAVAGVDLDIHAGEVIGVVGESGCGKSTLGRVIAGINPPSAGEVSYQGKPLHGMTAAEHKAYVLGVQMIRSSSAQVSISASGQDDQTKWLKSGDSIAYQSAAGQNCRVILLSIGSASSASFKTSCG